MNVFWAYVMIILAIVAIYYAAYHFKRTQALVRNGIIAQAEVVKLIEEKSSEGSTFQPVFEFVDVETNVIMTYHHITSSSHPKYTIGKMGYVVYSKDTDEKRLMTFYGLFQYTILLLIAGLLLIVWGMGYLLYPPL